MANRKKKGEPIEPVITSGTSIFEFPDGSVYEGEWVAKDGVKIRQGNGSFRMKYETYQGTWVDDMMNGSGLYTFSSGASYEGAFVNNLFEGYGVYSWPDGAVYKGNWSANKMHGAGEYTIGNKIFSGNFANGFFDTGSSIISLQSLSQLQETS